MQRRQQGWQRLEALLRTAQRRGLRALDPDEVAELGRLYRWVTSDVAFAEGRGFEPTLQAYLNRLAARAHAYVYGAAAQSGRDRVLRFYTAEFPSEVRRSKWFVLTCVVLFVLAAALAYWLVASKPVNAYVVLPAQMVKPIHKSLHDSNFKFNGEYAATMSAVIMTNNIKAAIVAFAGGMTLGTLTLYVIFFNGLILGGYGALFAKAGFGYDFWATVAPHGFIELTAIQIAGGAGLLLAGAVFVPGRLSRADALRRNARRAGVLILGVASMLVVAGTIEAFFSPLRYPADLRLGFGLVTALFMILYFGFAGRPHNAR